MFVTTPKHENSTALLITTIRHTYLGILLQKEGPSTVSMKVHWGMYFLRITYHGIINTTIHTLFQNEDAYCPLFYVRYYTQRKIA